VIWAQADMLDVNTSAVADKVSRGVIGGDGDGAFNEASMQLDVAAMAGFGAHLSTETPTECKFSGRWRLYINGLDQSIGL